MEEKITVPKETYEKLLVLANNWNELEKEVNKFYVNVDGEYDEDNPESEGDLCTIGEITATAFGYL